MITLSNRWTLVIWSSLLGKQSKASRVSEIQGLSIGKTHSLFERNGIKRLPNIQFLSKTQRLGKLCKPILITLVQTVQTWFCIPAKNKSNICTEQSPSWWRKSYKSNLQRPASKNSISKWTVSLMKYVYEQYIETLPSVSSHDTWKMSTSYAFLNGASVLVYCSLKPLLPRSVRRTFSPGGARFGKSLQDAQTRRNRSTCRINLYGAIFTFTIYVIVIQFFPSELCYRFCKKLMHVSINIDVNWGF